MNIKELIAARAASDPRLKAVLRKISDGTATLTDTAYYSDVYSDITGKMFSDNVLDLIGAEREEECIDVLRSSYDNINDICAQTQTVIDKAAGINIKPQKAPFPNERVRQIAHSLLDPTVSDSTIKRRANTGVANVSKGFHDSYIKVNAKFRNDAGLKVYINRETDGKCCEWCTAMAGRYSYGSEPDDVYRRHDNCGCTVTYENGKQRQDVWSKRSWTAPEVGAGAAEPVRFTSGNAPAGAGESVRLTKDQAAELQAKNMPKKSGKINNSSIDNSGGSGIIEETGETREFNPLPPEKVVPEMRKAFDSWLPSVSGEEYSSLVKYTKNVEKKGVKPFFERLNTALRDKVILSDRMKYHSDNISNAINKFNLLHDIVCYRATKKNFFDKYSVGELFYADYFLSSSASRAGALKGKFLTIIRAPKGSRCAYIEKLSLYPSQREVLFDKSCQYRVVEKNDKYMVIEVINND